MDQIEQTIQTDLSQTGKLPLKSIQCPETVQPKPGKTFECIGSLNPSGGFFITVRLEDARGRISWDIPHSWQLLNLSKLEAEVKDKLKDSTTTGVQVRCGENYRPTKPGDRFECQLIRQPQKQAGKILVSVEPEGIVTWQEVRQVQVPDAIEPNSPVTSTNSAAANAPLGEITQPTAQTIAGEPVPDASGWVELGE